MSDPLKETDRWCAHAKCPHLNDNTPCIECRREAIIEHQTMVIKGKED